MHLNSYSKLRLWVLMKVFDLNPRSNYRSDSQKLQSRCYPLHKLVISSAKIFMLQSNSYPTHFLDSLNCNLDDHQQIRGSKQPQSLWKALRRYYYWCGIFLQTFKIKISQSLSIQENFTIWKEKEILLGKLRKRP